MHFPLAPRTYARPQIAHELGSCARGVYYSLWCHGRLRWPGKLECGCAMASRLNDHAHMSDEAAIAKVAANAGEPGAQYKLVSVHVTE